METLKVRCRSCGRELDGHHIKTVSCGCPNMTTIRGDRISAVDLTQIVMLNSYHNKSKSTVLTSEDIQWQEERRQRKVKRLDFEVR